MNCLEIIEQGLKVLLGKTYGECRREWSITVWVMIH